MRISISELKSNPGKYVEMASERDVFVTKNGKLLAKITNAKIDKIAAAESLFGILPSNVDLDQSREERLK
jgi:prevent-host-death family protein